VSVVSFLFAGDKAGEKEKTVVDAAKEKGLAMGSVMDDSYAECFPDSFEKYNMELGPDSDDEAGMVRSKEEVYI